MRHAAVRGDAGAKIFLRLVRLARSWGASKAEAEDVAQIAVTKFLAGEWNWDQQKSPDVLVFLAGMVRSGLRDERARARRKHEFPSGEIDDAPDASPAAKAIDAERDARHTTAFDRLAADVADDPLAAAVVRLVEEGVDKPAAQAARLRCGVQEIYDANDRIRRHLRRIAREVAAEPDEKQEVAE